MEALVYWEKQDPKTKMCALHCLNSLLQGPVISADELCEISLILDSEENLLFNNTETSGYNGRVLGYGNVSDSGDFNLPVLQNALERRNISCTHFSLNQLSLKMFENNPSIGFILNIQAHWFSIRNLHSQWYILDSLREGPVPVEPGWLHDYIKESLEKGKGSVLVVIPKNGKFPEPEPFKYTKLQPYQFFLKQSEIADNSYDSGERKSFLFKNGESATKEVVWPTTGGIRLDQASSEPVTTKPEEDYEGVDSIKVAVKLFNNQRITKSFSSKHKVKKLFDWLEEKCDLREYDFYFLLQTVPFRKFIKYVNGSIELLTNDTGPSDVTDQTFDKLDFGFQEMFLLRVE